MLVVLLNTCFMCYNCKQLFYLESDMEDLCLLSNLDIRTNVVQEHL